MTSTTIKVFAGNLPFTTNDEQLKAMFAPAGTVVSATVISRGARSLGYGFVEMENEAAAKKAVDLMNKQTVDGRTVNVEIARARVATTGDGATGGDAGARGRRRNRTRGGRGGAGAGAEGGAAPRQAQAPREDRVQSQTTVFVANLPFTVDNAALLAAFKGVKAVDAQVSTRRGGRSKGFGFVLFANNADQQKAIAAMDGKQVEGREVAVKAAMTEFAAERARTDALAARPAPVAAAAPAAAPVAAAAAAAAPKAATPAAAATTGKPAATAVKPAASPAAKK